MKFLVTIVFTFFCLFLSQSYAASIKYLKVTKSTRTLEIIDSNETVIKSIPVMIGRSLLSGPKVQEGDNKTPEGSYILDWKNPNSKYYKSIHISYPNKDDLKRAKALGVKPGGDIMLHGFPNDLGEISDWLREFKMDELSEEAVRLALPYFNWTNGCIAVTNEQMEELYSMLKVPTQIIIVP